MNAHKVMLAAGIFLMVLCFQAVPSYGATFGFEDVGDPTDDVANVVVILPDASSTLEKACPTTGSYKNHGEYVSCVAQWVKENYEGTKEDKAAVISEAARSDIGRKSK